MKIVKHDNLYCIYKKTGEVHNTFYKTRNAAAAAIAKLNKGLIQFSPRKLYTWGF